MGRNYCQACSFARFGVKTRKSIPHTCGGEIKVVKSEKKVWIPTKKELDKYLKRLAEFWDAEKKEWK